MLSTRRLPGPHRGTPGRRRWTKPTWRAALAKATATQRHQPRCTPTYPPSRLHCERNASAATHTLSPGRGRPTGPIPPPGSEPTHAVVAERTQGPDGPPERRGEPDWPTLSARLPAHAGPSGHGRVTLFPTVSVPILFKSLRPITIQTDAEQQSKLAVRLTEMHHGRHCTDARPDASMLGSRGADFRARSWQP